MRRLLQLSKYVPEQDARSLATRAFVTSRPLVIRQRKVRLKSKACMQANSAALQCVMAHQKRPDLTQSSCCIA